MRWLTISIGVLAFLFLKPGAMSVRAQSGVAQQQFVPGELIVGYKSAQDRKSALKDIEASKGSLRGLNNGGGVQAQEIGGTALKLRFNFSEETARSIQGNRASELSLLKDWAKSLREGDGRVKYAHPNWIMNVDPVERDAVPQTMQKFSDEAEALKAPSAAIPDDPLYQLGFQWNYLPPPTGMNAVNAWKSISLGRTSVASRKKVVVAVIDTGLVYDHPDVASSGHVGRGYNFVSWDNCEKEAVQRGPDATDTGNKCHSDEIDSDWHGTHVAGIIGIVGTNNHRGIAGIAWDALVVPIRVLGWHGGNTVDISDAIRWAAGLPVEGVPDNQNPADVINMSLGGRVPCDEENFGELISAIADAREAGAVVVVSAGNGIYLDHEGNVCKPSAENKDCKKVREDIRGYQPASCPGVISVAASDPRGYLAYYSNFGDVTIMAPGGDLRVTKEIRPGEVKSLGVWSTVKGQYGAMQGTSQAAPHVSGAIALALAVHPEWRRKPDLIEQKLRDTAVSPPMGACPAAMPCGAGQLDARALIAAE